MKPLRESLIWASTTLVMLLGLAATPNLQAQDGETFECSNETFKGMYGFAFTTTVKVIGEREGDFHSVSTGFLIADGMGEITALN